MDLKSRIVLKFCNTLFLGGNMIDINVPNVITIGLITLLAIAAAKFARGMGVPIPV